MNNKMVPMAVLDLIWMGISSAALLAFVAIMGIILVKIGTVSFKIAMDVVGAARGIENIEGVIKRRNPRIAAEKDEIEIINNFINATLEKNHRLKYAYDLFKVESVASHISLFITKAEKINYEEYAYKWFKIEKALSHANSLKKFAESKRKKNFAKYAYIQLFKK